VVDGGEYPVRYCLAGSGLLGNDMTETELPLAAIFPLLTVSPNVGAEILSGRASHLTPEQHASLRRDLGALFVSGTPTLRLGAVFPAVYARLNSRLREEAFGTRAFNVLVRSGATTWRQLVGATAGDLLLLANFGTTSLGAVVSAATNESLEVANEESLPTSILPDGAVAQPTLLDDDELLESAGAIYRLSSDGATLADLLPGLSVVDHELVPDWLLPVRLLSRLPSPRWEDLLRSRLRDLLTIDNVGWRSVAELLVRLHQEEDALAARKVPDGGLTLVQGAIREIGAWMHQDRSARVVGDVLQLSNLQPPLPSRLAILWAEAADCELSLLSSGREIGTSIGDLLDSVDSRSLQILRGRVWLVDGRATLDEIGEQLGLTRERVRQLEGRVVEDLRQLLRSPQYVMIGDRAEEARRRLGSAALRASSRVAQTLTWLTADVLEDHRVTAERLLLWLAGPYQVDGDWMLLKGSSQPSGRGVEIRRAADQSGFVSNETLATVLQELGVHEDQGDAWITRVGGLLQVDGGWLDASGSIVDVALRYLSFRGVAMSTEEILRGIGRTDASTRSVRHRLFEDERVQRVSKSDLALRAWGLDEYTSVAEEMAEEIERSGGSMPLDLLVERLVERHDVSPASIRMYSGRPMFYLDARGVIALRDEDHPYELRDDLARVPFCYELSAGHAAWRVLVDREVLRGSGRHMPEPLAGWLRLRPGSNIDLANPRRPLPTAWRPWAQPDVGSLKAFAEDVGAQAGDWLVLVLDRAASVEVRCVPRRPQGSADLCYLASLVGAARPLDEDALSQIGIAVGVDTGDHDSLRFRIRAAFESRRESDLVAIIDEIMFT